MTIPEQIRALERLASVDVELKTLDELLVQERGSLETLKESLKKCEERLQADRASLAAAEKARSALVIEVRSMNQQIDHSRDKLGRARNEREVNAVQREQEELRKLLRDREDEVVKLVAQGDAIRPQLEGMEAEAKRLGEELAVRQEQVRARLEGVDDQRAIKAQERGALAKKLPSALFRRYEAIRQKRGVAIAQTTDGTCKACYMALPPQLFHRLRREPVLEQCPSCHRIIYFVPPPSPGNEADR